MLVSVVLPYRNEEHHLEACLSSLERQTDQGFELIAVDDGSTDRSAGIVAAHAGRFRRVVALETGGAGLVPALNAGLDRAQGEIIVRADADDLYHPRRIEVQRSLLSSGADVAGSRVRFFPRSALMEGFRLYEAWINRLLSPAAMAAEIYVETPIAHPSLALRRSLLDAIGGYRDLGWPEDFDLMLRAHRSGALFAKAPEVLHFWREHEDRLCRNDRRYDLEAFIRCRCHHLARGPLDSGRDLVLWGAGPIGKKTAAGLLQEGIDFEAFVDIDPRKIGGTIRGRKVCDASILKKKRFFVLGCVGKRNARYVVRGELESMGYRERLDFLLAA
jgi:glycosyltransferase involved in cell wall biosynthesis